MTDPIDVICIAQDHLQVASEALFEAADLFSDRQAEYHGDRGMGVPGKNPYIDRLYALSALLEEKIEMLEGYVRDA